MELLICDDCSSDSTPLIIDEWLGRSGNIFDRVIFIKHKKNHGVTETLNELISECRGELISPIASDDYYLEGAIALRRKAQRNNPKWLGAFSDGIAVGGDDKIFSNSLLLSSGICPDSLDSANIQKTVICKWAEPMNLQFWRRGAFKTHGGDFEFDGNVFCEDLQFALWALSENAFGFVNNQCVAYRCRTWPQSAPDHSRTYIRGKCADMSICYRNASRVFSQPFKKYMEWKAAFYMGCAVEDDRLILKHHNLLTSCSENKNHIIQSVIKKIWNR